MSRGIYNSNVTRHLRKELRNGMTSHEWLLWVHINTDKLGVRFRRQFGIGPYIADFYCPTLKLVIELDGSQHFTDKGIAHDKDRDAYLRSEGCTVIRFTNEELKQSTAAVIEEIRKTIAALLQKNI